MFISKTELERKMQEVRKEAWEEQRFGELFRQVDELCIRMEKLSFRMDKLEGERHES